MENVRSAVLMSCLVFLLSLAAVGCARQNTNTMNDSTMGTTMDNMNEEKMESAMEKPMDSMDAEKMDESMGKDMPRNMK